MLSKRTQYIALWIGVISGLITIFAFLTAKNNIWDFFGKTDNKDKISTKTQSNKDSLLFYQDKGNNIEREVRKPSYYSKPTLARKNNLEAEYLIPNENVPGDIEGIYDNIIAQIQTEGLSAKRNSVNYDNLDFKTIKGRFNKLLILKGKIHTIPSAFDERTLTSTYYYIISIYETETEKSTNTIVDKLVAVGFSLTENEETIKKKLMERIKSVL
jgi:hypothetical protein